MLRFLQLLREFIILYIWFILTISIFNLAVAADLFFDSLNVRIGFLSIMFAINFYLLKWNPYIGLTEVVNFVSWLPVGIFIMWTDKLIQIHFQRFHIFIMNEVFWCKKCFERSTWLSYVTIHESISAVYFRKNISFLFQELQRLFAFLDARNLHWDNRLKYLFLYFSQFTVNLLSFLVANLAWLSIGLSIFKGTS